MLDELPLAGDILPGLDPPIKARLFAAFDLQILWNKPGRQATVHAEITEATLRVLPALLNPGQDGYDDTADTTPGETADVEDLFESPIVHQILRRTRIYHTIVTHVDVGVLATRGGPLTCRGGAMATRRRPSRIRPGRPSCGPRPPRPLPCSPDQALPAAAPSTPLLA
ncbi:MAG TPA: hypothetical protein VIY52_23085 [Streptosporangiaceae bacterium]